MKNCILIVDDDPNELRAMEIVLKGLGVDVYCADSAAKARIHMDQIKPDLILMDVMMPVENGFDFCRQLKNNDSTREIPVIFLTGLEKTESIVEGFGVGGDDYLSKPISIEELNARVKNHLKTINLQTSLKARNNELQRTEDALRASEKKLRQWNKALEERIKERTSSLEDLNTALRVLLKKREEDKNQIGANIYANYKSLIQPLLNQLKNSLTMTTQEDILNILESSIKEMATPFSKELADPILGLTPTEIQVAALVKDGKTNKEIAQILNKSIRAISSHRDNIRLKFGLKNKKTNLRSYLLSLN